MPDRIPDSLAEIREEFLALGERDRLLLLLDFANDLPPLPPEFAGRDDLLERVEECQAPVFVLASVADDVVTIVATAPEEAPTTRGFASLLVHGLSGQSVEAVLSTPRDFAHELGITQAVSPLRLRGMAGMIARVQRQVRASAEA